MQKVGELLNKHEIAIDVFNKVGSIAKTADFVAAGLKNYDVVSLCNQGYIERIRNGFYKLPNAEEPKEEALISKLLPQGIVCVESALFYVFCKCKFLKFADKNGEFCISVLEKVAGCPAGLPDAS